MFIFSVWTPSIQYSESFHCSKTDQLGTRTEQSVLCNCRPADAFLNRSFTLTSWQHNKTCAFFSINWACCIPRSFFLVQGGWVFTCWISCKERGWSAPRSWCWACCRGCSGSTHGPCSGCSGRLHTPGSPYTCTQKHSQQTHIHHSPR